MDAALQGAAAAYLAPKVLNRFHWRWLLYGAGVYFGLKLMKKRGIFPSQTGAALDVIDSGIDFVKEQVGLNTVDSRASVSESAPIHH